MYKLIQKKKTIILSFLGSLITITIFLLGIAPFINKEEIAIEKTPNVLNKEAELDKTIDKNAPKDPTLSSEDRPNNETIIKMGVNSIIDGNGASIHNNDIEINEDGIYNISGSLIDGHIIVDTTSDITIILDNATFRNSNIVLQEEANVKIKLIGDTLFLGVNEPVSTNKNYSIEGSGGILLLNNELPIKSHEAFKVATLKEEINSNETIIIENQNSLTSRQIMSNNQYNIIQYSNNTTYKIFKIVDGEKQEIILI